MTRNEQILSEVQKRFSSNDAHLVSKISTFIDGAKWADENPQSELVNKDEFVAKVRNWLEKHTYDDKYWTPDGDDLFLGNLIGDICKYLEE